MLANTKNKSGCSEERTFFSSIQSSVQGAIDNIYRKTKMKIYTKNGVLTAEAESVDDVRSLMAFQEVSNRKISDMTKPVGYPMKRGPYKKGKKNYIKPCPICGQKVKGLLGLSIHSKLTHGAWDKNKKVVPGTEPVLQTNDGGRGYSSGFGAGR